jgi:hypothetical protein
MLITVSEYIQTMEASCGLTIGSRLTTMVVMDGVFARLPGVFMDGAESGLRCLSVVVMLACISGTRGVIQEIDGSSHALVAPDLAARWLRASGAIAGTRVDEIVHQRT